MKNTVVFLLIAAVLSTMLFSPFSVMAADTVFCQPGLEHNLTISGSSLSTKATDYGTGYYADTTSGNRTLFFDIDDSVINGNTSFKNAVVTIEYFDTGEDGKYFAFEYDAQSNTKKRAEKYAEMANANTKKTIVFRLEDAYFGNRLSNKADFSIVMPKMETVYFYKISVDILDEISGIDISIADSEFGNIFFDDSAKKIKLAFENAHTSGLNLNVNYSIVKEYESDNVIYSSEKNIFALAGEKAYDTFKIPVSIRDYANYILKIEAVNASKNIRAKAEIPFSVCVSMSENELNPHLGVGAHFNWGGRDTKSSIEILKKTGFSNIREGYSWPAFETVSNGERSYNALDVCSEYIENAYQNGIKTLVMAGYTNVDVLNTIPEEAAAAADNGYTIDAHYIPVTEKGRKAYIDYILKVLELYDGKIDTVEIWNEPNLRSYGSNTYTASDGVSNYANLLKESYTAIKNKYPNVKVAGPVISSVMSYALEWLDAFLASEDIHNYYDVFSFHSYSYSGNNLDTILEYLKNAKLKIPSEKEIIVTEFGVGSDISDEDKDYEYQAAGLVKYYLTMDVNSIADKYYIYQFSHENTRYESYGMLKAHNAKYPYAAKPSFLAVANMNKRIAGAYPVSYEMPDSAVRKLTYHNPLRDTDIYVFYSSNNDITNFTLADTGKKTEFFDMYGNKLNVSFQNAGYVLDISREPVYMVVHNKDDVEVSAFKNGDGITLNGISRNSDINDAVALKIFDKDGNLIYINQTNIDENLNFEFDFIPLSKSDIYTVNLGNKAFDNIFELTLTEGEMQKVKISAIADETLVTTYNEFNSADKVTVKASFKDISQTGCFTVIIGYYKDNSLVKSQIVKNTDMTALSDGIYNYDITDKDINADTVKIFLVDSFDNLKPLTKSVELK